MPRCSRRVSAQSENGHLPNRSIRAVATSAAGARGGRKLGGRQAAREVAPTPQLVHFVLLFTLSIGLFTLPELGGRRDAPLPTFSHPIFEAIRDGGTQQLILAESARARLANDALTIPGVKAARTVSLPPCLSVPSVPSSTPLSRQWRSRCAPCHGTESYLCSCGAVISDHVV